MRENCRSSGSAAFAIMLLSLLFATHAMAQESEMPAIDILEVDRDSFSLQDELQEVDRDLVNTALVFTNVGGRQLRVICRGFDGDGEPVGRVGLTIPGGGLRFALASDLSNGADFIGHVRCRARHRLRASSLLIAPSGITDLSADMSRPRGGIVFPVVATY